MHLAENSVSLRTRTVFALIWLFNLDSSSCFCITGSNDERLCNVNSVIDLIDKENLNWFTDRGFLPIITVVRYGGTHFISR